MKKNNIYLCPETKQELHIEIQEMEGDKVINGCLQCKDGSRRYPIVDGIPEFVDLGDLNFIQKETQQYYDSVAQFYDGVANLSFSIQYVDECEARRRFVQRLNLTPCSRVLEIACGTGRDTEIIASELGAIGEFYVQDLSRSMLLKCKDKLSNAGIPIEYSVGNACYLPFPDNYFDAVYSFGGISVFGDISKALKEIVRVCKVGAKVVVGDESMAPWLYEAEYGKILLNNNPLFKAELPLKDLPVEAREVNIQWVVGGVYYLIDFIVGEGEPGADFDREIPGKRGGTLRTRYYGRLEGVTNEAFDLAHKAREKSGKSMHQWLDDVVREAAKKELEASTG